MTYWARVFIEPGSDADAHPVSIGEKELGARPALNAGTTFEHRGKEMAGLIDVIAPADWETLGVVPTILVIQQRPE